MKEELNYDKEQLKEQEQTNLILWINTVATVIAAITGLVLVYLQFNH